MLRLSLIIPSYQRPADLARALHAAAQQVRPFEEIIVVVRDGDDASGAVARQAGALVVTVRDEGVLAAMRAGVDAATGTHVVFTDDDAVAPPEWGGLIAAHFLHDPQLAGVGGRDVLFDRVDGVPIPRPTTLTTDVGRYTVFGRLIGNHHRGEGAPSEVVVLKGVNAAYRRDRLALPTSLRGGGAQAHFEVAVGTSLRQRGERLLYDPTLTVSHFPADRVGADQRQRPTAQAVADSAFNLLRATPRDLQRRRYWYTMLIGDRAYPGIMVALGALLTVHGEVARRWRPTWRGMRDAWRERDSPLEFATWSAP